MTTRKGVASHLYFTKKREWESEREFRAVVLLWDLPETEVHVRLEVPYGEALKAIVVGEGFQDFALLDDAVSKNFQGRAPDILRCSWRAGAPVLRNV
jgi:hypothetical protein